MKAKNKLNSLRWKCIDLDHLENWGIYIYNFEWFETFPKIKVKNYYFYLFIYF